MEAVDFSKDQEEINTMKQRLKSWGLIVNNHIVYGISPSAVIEEIGRIGIIARGTSGNYRDDFDYNLPADLQLIEDAIVKLSPFWKKFATSWYVEKKTAKEVRLEMGLSNNKQVYDREAQLICILIGMTVD